MSTHPHMSDDEIENRFGYHRATFPAGYAPDKGNLLSFLGSADETGNEATAPTHAAVRRVFMDTAHALVTLVPHGREQALMLTALQEASMWANAGVAMQSPLVRE
jgi:hypothetical protein